MFFIVPFTIELPQIPTVEIQENIQKVSQAVDFATYSDATYSQKEVNFSCGQMVYVRYQLSTDKTGKALVTVLDANKKQIHSFEPNYNGGIYSGSFVAPGSFGTYYVHLEITGEGLAVSMERNINVDCEITEQTPEENSVLSYSPTPGSSALSTFTPPSEATPASSLLSRIKAYFVKIFRIFGVF